jgi:putative methyltransferase (TIGR04325 family)
VYRHYFDRATGHIRLFHGLYPDYRTALKAIPDTRCAGVDNGDSVYRIAHERFRICDFDYPILFWLERLLPECELLFDWGGGVGISYFGYRKFLQYRDGLRWLVSDLPAVAVVGNKIAQEEAAPHLQFTTTLDELPRSQILLAAGSLQFMEDPFNLLGRSPDLPPHILLNKVPIYDRGSAWTLHNLGPSICAYQLFNREQFLSQFHVLGYSLIDEWRTPELGCDIPFFPEHSIRAYTGFYLKRR